ncbi:MAG: DUF4244 domain-containing protein [Ancrocorticia sp.]|uniref:DUF4244 domain-containing protein n=2 Tax=Ancrocorticia sp. TaxID=2593684 RepID=UPI003F9047F6
MFTKENSLMMEEHNAESGMATAEYAVGTMAASSFAGIILWLVQQDWLKDAVESIFKNIFKM